MNGLFRPEWSTLKKLIFLQSASGGGYATVTGNPVSFSAKAAPLRKLEVAFSPVQSGSGDPSPDNVRPISGWSSLHVYDDPLYAGVIEWNQLIPIPSSDVSASLNGITLIDNRDGSFSISGTASADASFNITDAPMAAYTGHKYAVVGTPSSGSASSYFWQTSNAIIDAGNGTIYDRASYATNSWYGTIRVKAGTSIETPVVFRPQYCDLTEMFGAGNEPATVEEFKALFPHDYYPYNAGTETLVGTVNGMDTRSISISLGETVYSGYVDVISGVGEVTMASVDLGTLNWTYYGSLPLFATKVVGGKPTGGSTPSSNVFCSQYAKFVGGYRQLPDDSIMVGSNFYEASSCAVVVHDETYTDAAAFKTAVTGVQLVYELATPLTIQLTPQEVQSLLGENVLFSDANGDLTVEYRSN